MQLSNLKVNLSKNSWHRKLQTFTFGSDVPLYPNLCPYFWLTVACLICGPAKYLLVSSKALFLFSFIKTSNALMYVCKTIFSKPFFLLVACMALVADLFVNTKYPWSITRARRKVDRRRTTKAVLTLTDRELIYLYKSFGNILTKLDLWYHCTSQRFNFWEAGDPFSLTEECWMRIDNAFISELSDKFTGKMYKDAFKTYKMLSSWRAITPDYIEKQKQLKALTEEYARIAREKEKRERIRREKLATFTTRLAMLTESVCKVVVIAFLAACALAAVYGGYEFTVYMFFNGGMTTLLTWLSENLFGVTVAIAVGISVPIVTSLAVILNHSRVFNKIGRWFIDKVVHGKLELFFHYLKAVKQRQCPQIEWSE